MKKNALAARCAAVLAGAALLTAVAGAAVAEENYGDQDVDVNVSIAELTEPGVLAMTVAGTSTDLTETGSTELVRQFTGTLPTVTVTDTRTADEIPADAGWYVLGSASEFTGDAGQEPIGADHFGWTPRLLDGGDSGLVTEGDQVDTVLDDSDDAVGLVDQELLALALDSGAVAEEGQWTASADLFLRTDATVEAGDYTGQLTLSLFE
ncbi:MULTISPECIES: hypothetical protein [unclassified Rathayibacter]|uniref:hypothetical protein n=1 Tax=unclassified Rathayibacter TaxID=2609250 RepID=UPI000CE86E91|nr:MULTISPECIES: hypothetical protein [unclassified Rathayibacter]PPG08362.1 hypothetical protein C5C26_08045 [Rathayibacter sp. AY2B1]PPG72903.1 hypothetical protein C5C59_05340 [Rathayibacter sp. AY1F4]